MRAGSPYAIDPGTLATRFREALPRSTPRSIEVGSATATRGAAPTVVP